MALRKFSESSEVVDFQSLPWVNEFCKQVEDWNEPRQVKIVSECPSGVMIVTYEFKGVIRGNDSSGKELIEAVQVFAGEKSINPVIYCQIKKDRRNLELLIDDEDIAAKWHHTEGRYVQALTRQEIKQTGKKKGNRFLAERGVLTSTGAENKEPTTTSAQEVPSTAPTKGRKG